MATDCTSSALCFQGPGRREIRADFDGGDITSDAGVLLLQEVESRTQILAQFAHCFEDHRDPERVEHTVEDMLKQRVLGIALGYEDLNDHDELRADPLLAAVVGKKDPKGVHRVREKDRGAALAASSTLNRVELSRPEDAQSHRYKRVVLHEDLVDQVFIDLFVQSFTAPPEEIVLDFDATDDPLHGRQEGRFFHGYYGHYCYMPLYVFSGDHLLTARLRPANIDAAHGTVDELRRLVPALREQWPEVRILVRGDSGFCRDEIMKWCEDNHVDYLFGLARNPRLVDRISGALAQAMAAYERTGAAARVFRELRYRTKKSWSCTRRVVAKAEHLGKGSNPRFVVTSLTKKQVDARELYEDRYCARGDMENRIKEQQLFCFADRTSAGTMRANQTRLYFASIAYTLLEALRRIGLSGTDLVRAQCHTLRTKLLKIGAVVRVSVRKVWVSMTRACPYAEIFRVAVQNLRAPPAVRR